MDLGSLRRLGYAVIAIDGAFSALAPGLAARKNCLPWAIAFDNVGELEPKPWYRRATRAVGVGMVAAGLAGLVFERRARGLDASARPDAEDLTEPDPADDTTADDPNPDG